MVNRKGQSEVGEYITSSFAVAKVPGSRVLFIDIAGDMFAPRTPSVFSRFFI